MRTILTLLFCLIAFTACKQVDEKAVSEEARQMMDAYHNDIREEGLLAEFKYLDSTDDFYWVPPGYDSAIDYDSVATILRQNANAYAEIDNSWEVLEITPLSNDSAIYSGKLKSRMTDTAGKTMIVNMLESGVLIKRKNGWKLLCGQTSVLNDLLETSKK